MKDLYAGVMEWRHRMPVWEYKKLGVGSVCMCVFVCAKCFRGERGRVVGKLSHHLFIQSTEEGVSGGRGGGLPSVNHPGNTVGQELFF